MSGKKVVATKNLPMHPPITLTIACWLLLDRLRAPAWVWGAVGTLLGLIWLIALYEIFTQEPTELKELQSSRDAK